MSEYIVMELFKIYVGLNPWDFKNRTREQMRNAFVEFAQCMVAESDLEEPDWFASLG